MKVKKVLVIDDNQDITDAISFNLSSIGIECKITNRGRQGLDIIKNNADNADIVLLDRQSLSLADLMYLHLCIMKVYLKKEMW
jgi:DNA-binding response OmpR family regulator